MSTICKVREGDESHECFFYVHGTEAPSDYHQGHEETHRNAHNLDPLTAKESAKREQERRGGRMKEGKVKTTGYMTRNRLKDTGEAS